MALGVLMRFAFAFAFALAACAPEDGEGTFTTPPDAGFIEDETTGRCTSICDGETLRIRWLSEATLLGQSCCDCRRDGHNGVIAIERPSCSVFADGFLRSEEIVDEAVRQCTACDGVP